MLHGLILGVVLAASPKPAVIRHLNFHFGLTVERDAVTHSSGIGAGGGAVSGINHARSSETDEGTITADVVGVRPDFGLVFNVSEVSRRTAPVPQAQCIVWGVGTVVCEPGKHVTAEEQGLLRFLGRGFVNRSLIDAQGRWRLGVSSKDHNEDSDYTIVQDKADPLQIKFQRTTKEPGPMGFDATTNGTLVYSEALTVPLAINEDTLLRTQMIDGDYIPGGYEQVRTTMNFRLTDDSLSQARKP
jgi:hypothetical protein